MQEEGLLTNTTNGDEDPAARDESIPWSDVNNTKTAAYSTTLCDYHKTLNNRSRRSKHKTETDNITKVIKSNQKNEKRKICYENRVNVKIVIRNFNVKFLYSPFNHTYQWQPYIGYK